jgi:acyl-coenzyme A synthetase/AMP-(fatty) acid ligase
MHDGRLLFQGRIDRMIKLRGYRIQPEEVEQVLTQHVGVRAATVSLFSDGPREKMGAVVVVKQKQNDDLERDLIRHCQGMLPLYMVPERIVFVDSMPRGNRGKISLSVVVRLLES